MVHWLSFSLRHSFIHIQHQYSMTSTSSHSMSSHQTTNFIWYFVLNHYDAMINVLEYLINLFLVFKFILFLFIKKFFIVFWYTLLEEILFLPKVTIFLPTEILFLPNFTDSALFFLDSPVKIIRESQSHQWELNMMSMNFIVDDSVVVND